MPSKKISSISPLLKGETQSLTGLTTKNPFKDMFNYSFFYSIDLEFYKRDEINKITYLNGILGIKDKELKEVKDKMSEIKELKELVLGLIQKVNSIDNKVDKLEHKVDDGFIEIHNKVDSGFAEIHKRIDYVENKVDAGFENINNRLDIIEKNVVNLNGEVFGKKELME